MMMMTMMSNEGDEEDYTKWKWKFHTASPNREM